MWGTHQCRLISAGGMCLNEQLSPSTCAFMHLWSNVAEPQGFCCMQVPVDFVFSPAACMPSQLHMHCVNLVPQICTLHAFHTHTCRLAPDIMLVAYRMGDPWDTNVVLLN